MKESKEKKEIIDLEKNHSIIEKYFERALWGTRYVVVMAAVFSTLSAITLFFIGSYEIIDAITSYCLSSLHESANGHGHKKILASFIGGIDLYLIGVVLLIFGFGIYELFVSKIDIARMDADDLALPNRLECQIKYLKEHHKVDVIGTGAEVVTADKKTIMFKPKNHISILKNIEKVNPFFH